MNNQEQELRDTLRILVGQCTEKKRIIRNIDKKISDIQKTINNKERESTDSGTELEGIKENIRILQANIARKRKEIVDPWQKKIKEKKEERKIIQEEIELLKDAERIIQQKKKEEEEINLDIQRIKDAYKVASMLKKNKTSIQKFLSNSPVNIGNTDYDNIQSIIDCLCKIKPVIEQQIGRKL
jgi:chromosome segregation ATPase